MIFSMKRKRLFLLFILVVFLFFMINKQISLFYPIEYKEQIRRYATTYHVDPFLVASIIKVETNFKTNQTSSKGALGIMQLMPTTAFWISHKLNIKEIGLNKIQNNVDTNIQLGTWYIHHLFHVFKGNPIAVTAAYNAGPNQVKKWMKEGIWDGKEQSIKHIPFGQTRHYVKRVCYYYSKYKNIYKIL